MNKIYLFIQITKNHFLQNRKNHKVINQFNKLNKVSHFLIKKVDQLLIVYKALSLINYLNAK